MTRAAANDTHSGVEHAPGDPQARDAPVPSDSPDSPGWLAGLDLLATGVLLVGSDDRIMRINSAAQQLLDVSARFALGQPLEGILGNAGELTALLRQARQNQFGQKRVDFPAGLPGRDPLDLLLTLVVIDRPDGPLLIELQENDVRMRAYRDERLTELASENRDLLRNLAHEVKNPLGGIRGAAQLLEIELEGSPLRADAQVIVKEADRLSQLVDRLLIPHRQSARIGEVNIHEVCERVRALMLGEFPSGLEVVRDYDTSLPPVRGDREQLIQAVLNLARNAAQALEGNGRIDLRTRVARQVTIARRRHKLALELHVIDNGPGIAASVRDRVFLPLVSGRGGGTGLGLTLAQTFVQQHGGTIECDSRPGLTDFTVVIPWSDEQPAG